ncbi:NAD(P)H-binding protein, partial [Nocardia gipuzkoensis]
MRIAVIGASGRIGGAVAEVLKDRGHEVIPITRAAGVDVHSGEGLAAALRGADAVVDAANAATTETAAVTEFFGTVARTVQREAAAAGVRHIVLVSIIGIDRFSGG